jgi:hypothetical protein
MTKTFSESGNSRPGKNLSTGDNAVGGVVTPSGLGAYASRNDGRTWTKSAGVPDGLTAYKVVVDPNHASVSYVATGNGLYRSTDDGVTYANVAAANGLPVLPYNGKLIVGTDVGAFISSTAAGGTYQLLGNLPPMPVVHLVVDPSNPKRIIAATYARGVWAFSFA